MTPSSPRVQAALGSIAPLDNLRGKRAFLYRGQNDTCYNKGSVNATANFFRRLMPAASVFFETKVESPHLVPGVDPYLCWWEEWGGPDNCTYDGAGHALRWIYGDRALGNGRDNSTAALAKKLAAFDQRPYFPKNGQDPLLADAGEIFVPDVCMAAGAGVGAGAGCKLHFFFHGCGVTPTFDVFAAYGGFNEWAEKNGVRLGARQHVHTLHTLHTLHKLHTLHTAAHPPNALCCQGPGRRGVSQKLAPCRATPRHAAPKAIAEPLPRLADCWLVLLPVALV